MPEPTIRPLTEADWPAVEAIHVAGIATGNATFETAPPTWAEFDTSKLADHRLVADLDGRVVGWAAAVAVSDRCTYAGVVEHSVYVDLDHQCLGIGRALLSTPSSPRPRPLGSGRSSPASSPRTPPASPSTNAAGSASSAPENASATSTAPGATSS